VKRTRILLGGRGEETMQGARATVVTVVTVVQINKDACPSM
jgi:hypothetical protein